MTERGAYGKAMVAGTQLTEKQAIFAKKVAEGYRPSDAARLAGYTHPEPEAVRLMDHPAVIPAIHRHRQRYIDGELAVKALKTLEDLLSPQYPGNVRFQAAKHITTLAGHGSGEESNKNKDLGSKDPSSMTLEELEAYIDEGRKRLASMPDITPHSAPDGALSPTVTDVDPSDTAGDS